MMKNVRAEGEVNILAHRLAEKEQEVEDLQAHVTQLEVLCYSSVTFVSFIVLLTVLLLHFFPTPVSYLFHAPCLLHSSFIYFIRGCAPYSIIMFNHDDSIPFPTLFTL